MVFRRCGAIGVSVLRLSSRRSVKSVGRSARSKFPQSKHEASSLIPFSPCSPPQFYCGVASNSCVLIGGRGALSLSLFIDWRVSTGDHVKKHRRWTRRQLKCVLLVNASGFSNGAASRVSKKEIKHASERESEAETGNRSGDQPISN